MRALLLRKAAKGILGPRGVAAIRAYRGAPSVVAQVERGDHAERERLADLAEHADLLKLHVGCGPRILKGWANIDLAYEPFEHYMQFYGERYYGRELRGARSEFFALDVTLGLPLPAETVDAVFHEDFIEHLNQRDAVGFLAEVWRVLKPGGVHRVNTPNLAVSMSNHANFRDGLSGVYVAEWDQHGHKNVWTPAYLEETARLVGYRDIIFNGRDRSVSPLMPPEYRPDPRDRPEEGNLFADLVK